MERFTDPGLCHHFSQHPPWLSTQMVQHMKACGSGFQTRQISWQNSSWLLSNELLSVTLKTDMRSRKKPVTFEILASFISPSIYAQITWKYHHNKAYLMENTSAPVNGLKYIIQPRIWDIYQNTRPEFGTLYVKVMTFLFYECYFSHRQDSFAVSFISIGPVSKELWLF